MIRGNHERRGHEHAPVAVEGEKGQRAEHMEMCFEASAGEMDQEHGGQHLADGDDVARGGPAGPQQRQRHGIDGDGAAESDRQPDVQMDPASEPSQLRGEIQTAAAIAAAHCTIISAAKRRSVSR